MSESLNDLTHFVEMSNASHWKAGKHFSLSEAAGDIKLEVRDMPVQYPFRNYVILDSSSPFDLSTLLWQNKCAERKGVQGVKL